MHNKGAKKSHRKVKTSFDMYENLTQSTKPGKLGADVGVNRTLDLLPNNGKVTTM